MLIGSAGSGKLYDDIVAQSHAGVADRGLPLSMGPTMVKLHDPVEDVEDVVRLLDEATPEGRRRNRWLQRRDRSGTIVDAKGRPTVDGRACCSALARSIDRSLHYMRPGVTMVCPGCKTTWVIQILVREERRHGR